MKKLNRIDPSDQLAPLKILLIVFGLLLGHGTVQWSARSPYTPTIRLRIPQFFSYSFSVRFLFEKTNKKGRCWPTKNVPARLPPFKVLLVVFDLLLGHSTAWQASVKSLHLSEIETNPFQKVNSFFAASVLSQKSILKVVL